MQAKLVTKKRLEMSFADIEVTTWRHHWRTYWRLLLSSCADSYPGPGPPAAPPAALAGKLGRWNVRCCSLSPRQRWTFQRRSVAGTGPSWRGPATTGRVPEPPQSETTVLLCSRLTTCTAGTSEASLPARPRVLPVRFADRMLAAEMLMLLLNIFLYFLCPGKQTAVVRCVNRKQDEEVDDALCDPSSRPSVMIRICNPEPCPPR